MRTMRAAEVRPGDYIDGWGQVTSIEVDTIGLHVITTNIGRTLALDGRAPLYVSTVMRAPEEAQ